jgi:hypothetical protein
MDSVKKKKPPTFFASLPTTKPSDRRNKTSFFVHHPLSLSLFDPLSDVREVFFERVSRSREKTK